jgi:hypothetical protein
MLCDGTEPLYLHTQTTFSIKIIGIDWGMAKLYEGSTVGVKFYITFIDFTTEMAVLLPFVFRIKLKITETYFLLFCPCVLGSSF